MRGRYHQVEALNTSAVHKNDCISETPSLYFPTTLNSISYLFPLHFSSSITKHSRNLLRQYSMAQIDYRALLIHWRPPHCTEVAEGWGEMDKSTTCLIALHKQLTVPFFSVVLWEKSKLNNETLSYTQESVYMVMTTVCIHLKLSIQRLLMNSLLYFSSIWHPTLKYFFRGNISPSNCCKSLLRENYQRHNMKSQLIHLQGH